MFEGLHPQTMGADTVTTQITLQLCGAVGVNVPAELDRALFMSLPFGHPLRELGDDYACELALERSATAKAEADAQEAADDLRRADLNATGAGRCFEKLSEMADQACEDDDGEPVTHPPRVQALIDAVRQLARYDAADFADFAAFADHRVRLDLIGAAMWQELRRGTWESCA